ncbi:MAG: DUF6339 family protein, partial [Myxococcota bacterium]
MTRLMRLHPDAARFVTPELAGGGIDRWPEHAFVGLLEELERDLALDAVDAAVDEVLRTTPAFDPAMDAEAAVRIHRALPLSRREACEPGVWRYLAVVHRPDFVRHRWENRTFAQTRARFWRFGTRPDSNAFSRLWWIAELTRDGDDYALTRAVLARQPLANNLFSRELSWHRPLVAAVVEVLGSQPSGPLEAALGRLQKRLSTAAVETLDPPALLELVKSV